MNIKLSILVEAAECLELVRLAELRGERLPVESYMRVLKAAIDFSGAVQRITNASQVEVLE